MDARETEALDRMRRLLAELPVARLLGASAVAWHAADERAVIAFEARPEFCNLMGNVQGGLLTAMLDMAMAFGVICAMEEGYVVPSLEIKTSYVAPAKPGRLVGEGRPVRRGRSVAFMEGKLADESGRLIATASATGQIRPRFPKRDEGGST
jgi:uncharacterized protein (TIGR00369 family)